MKNVILKANSITKSFQTTKKNNLAVLKGISLNIEAERISVIIGSSGAGKSTLLHILSGLDRPDSGDIVYDGSNIFTYTDDKLAKFRNNNIGFVFQFHHLLPEFSALENVIIPQLIKGVSLSNAQVRGNGLLKDLGLSDRSDHKPAELSGGEQQRVAIARALANNPSVIFADEPTGNLDSENSRIIHNLLFELRDKYKKTFVIVTHNPEMVQLADQIFEIKDGTIAPEILSKKE